MTDKKNKNYKKNQEDNHNKEALPLAVKPKLKSKQPIIKVEKAEKKFTVGRNVVHVLKGVDVEIFPQEFIVILGPSGSGKSTLLNVMLGLEPPTVGRVYIGGADVTDMKPNKIGKIRYLNYGIVFQRAEWVRSISVMQNVALPLAINNVGRKEREEKAIAMLKQVGMDSHAKYFPTELSGGQQQKVTLARAMINDPKIVIADEPTGNLDSKSAEMVLGLLQDLNSNQKKTILMVTHNIDYVRYASRTIYIRDGKVIEGSEQFLSS